MEKGNGRQAAWLTTKPEMDFIVALLSMNVRLNLLICGVSSAGIKTFKGW
jgi:hypothetical protein